MGIKRSLILLGCVLCLASPGWALKMTDVIQLAKAGVPDATIIAEIQADGSRFKLSADQLILLRKEGVSDEVIQAMINTRKPNPNPEPRPYYDDWALWGDPSPFGPYWGTYGYLGDYGFGYRYNGGWPYYYNYGAPLAYPVPVRPHDYGHHWDSDHHGQGGWHGGSGGHQAPPPQAQPRNGAGAWRGSGGGGFSPREDPRDRRGR